MEERTDATLLAGRCPRGEAGHCSGSRAARQPGRGLNEPVWDPPALSLRKCPLPRDLGGQVGGQRRLQKGRRHQGGSPRRHLRALTAHAGTSRSPWQGAGAGGRGCRTLARRRHQPSPGRPRLVCVLRPVPLPGTLTTCVFIYQQYILNCIFMAQCTFHS